MAPFTRQIGALVLIEFATALAEDESKTSMRNATASSDHSCFNDGECLPHSNEGIYGTCCSGVSHGTFRCGGFHGVRCGAIPHEDEAAADDFLALMSEGTVDSNEKCFSDGECLPHSNEGIYGTCCSGVSHGTFRCGGFHGVRCGAIPHEDETATDDVALMSEEIVGSNKKCFRDGECLPQLELKKFGTCCSKKSHKTLRCGGVKTGFYPGVRCGAAQFLV